jgi:hypothetical protein
MTAAPPSRPARPLVGLLALILVGTIVFWDLLQTGLPDPFSVPPPVALGSGAAPAGAHCAAN